MKPTQLPSTFKGLFRPLSGNFILGRNVLMLLLIALLSLGLMAGCKRKYPAGILKPEEIKPILLDVMVATEVQQMDTTAATRLHIRDSVTLEIHRVLVAHKVDDSLYFRSMAYYEANPDVLKKLLDSTKALGNKLQDSLEKKRFKTVDSATGPAIRPKTESMPVEGALKMPKKPVNPTVKDSPPIPVIKVKKQLQKTK